MKLLKISLSVVWFISIIGVWQPAASQSAGSELTVYGGRTFFNNPEFDSITLVEFPFTLNRDEFSFFRPDSNDTNYYARIFAQVNLVNTEGIVIDSDKTYFSVVLPRLDLTSVKGFKLFNKLMLPVHPGIYSAHLNVIDVVSKKEGHFNYDRLVVEPPIKNHLSFGGVSLAYDISFVGDEPSENAQMVINGFKVLNCPLSVFSNEDTAVYIYAELYNLHITSESPSLYQIAYKIYDDSNRVFIDYGSKRRNKPGQSAVITEVFDIKGWPSGIYLIQMIASDPASQEEDTTVVPFRIFNPVATPALATDGYSTVDPYDSLSLDEKINLVEYLLTPIQKQTLEKLSDEGKGNYLDQYWKEHDDNISTRIIEKRQELIIRYRFSNQYFSFDDTRTQGWKTDRGRIYMTYGPWDEIEDINAPIIGNPYVVWHYHAFKEGKVFVFEDKEGYGDYTLVHSNVNGEIYSGDWKERLEGGDTEIY